MRVPGFVPYEVVSVEVAEPYVMGGVGDESWCWVSFHKC